MDVNGYRLSKLIDDLIIRAILSWRSKPQQPCQMIERLSIEDRELLSFATSEDFNRRVK